MSVSYRQYTKTPLLLHDPYQTDSLRIQPIVDWFA